MNDVSLDRTRYVLGDPSDHVGLLNCERIADRRHIHGWKVGVHYHDGLCQLFLFGRGRVTGRIEGRSRRLDGPTLVWMPALCHHGFDYEPEMQGWVITVPSSDVSRLCEGRTWLRDRLHQSQIVRGPERAELLADTERLTRRIEEEHRRQGEDRNLALEALFQLLLLSLHRGIAGPSASPRHTTDRQQQLVQRFRDLLDRHFGEVRSVAEFARMLAVTPTHLSRCARAVTGQTAGGIIQDRILLEAKRQLHFTDRTVEEIAFQLGFSTPSYFNRFFRARTGEPPGRFRRQARYGA